MALCADGLLRALNEMEDNDGKMIPHHEDYTLEEVLTMFDDGKEPEPHMLRWSDGTVGPVKW